MPYNPRSVEEVFKDYKGRRAGMVKALTTGLFFVLESFNFFVFLFLFPFFFWCVCLRLVFYFCQMWKSSITNAILVSSRLADFRVLIHYLFFLLYLFLNFVCEIISWLLFTCSLSLFSGLIFLVFSKFLAWKS